MTKMESANIDNAGLNLAFSLTEGGPGTAFMKRLRLIHPQLGAGSARTALTLMALTWVPLFLLCLIEGLAFGGVKIPFVYDIGAHTRFLFTVPVLVLADIPVGIRLRQIVRHFVTARLVREDELARFGQILLDALRFRDSHLGEMIVIVLAYVGTYKALTGSLQGGGTWFRPVAGQGLSPVGYWYALVALPIFQFLIFRWIYRMIVWSSLLLKVSKLDLQLTPTHPDGAGGLGFIGKGIIPFGVILFALSAVVSGGIASRILFGGGKLEDYQWSYATLFVIALIVFAGPLLIFVPRLLALKQLGLMQYGTLGSQYTQAFHRRWIEETGPTTEEPLLGTADIQSLADLGNSFEIIRKMKIVPAELSDFIALVLPGLLPALPLAATVMPVGDIVKGLLKLIA